MREHLIGTLLITSVVLVAGGSTLAAERAHPAPGELDARVPELEA